MTKGHQEIAAPLPRMWTAIFLSSALRNSARSLGSDRGVGDKGVSDQVVGLGLSRGSALSRYMTSYGRSPDYVGLNPTCKAGDLLVLNDDDVAGLLKAAVKREGSQAAFAKRYDVHRSELNSILNGRRRISTSLAKALGFRRVYVVE
jgi:hypothetical protein